VNNHSHCTVCGECLFDPHACGGKCLGPPECGDVSPLGGRCTIHEGHDGWHRGFGPKGRHSWIEKVQQGDEP
jgi:hypothetical protein